jgi:hypothetical protein
MLLHNAGKNTPPGAAQGFLKSFLTPINIIHEHREKQPQKYVNITPQSVGEQRLPAPSMTMSRHPLPIDILASCDLYFLLCFGGIMRY